MSAPSDERPRRTFAIISHPDAGKTTLTEKLLLYAGAIHLAGSVKSRRAGRHALSDWMQMERERGISVSSSVLQFPYAEVMLNLLDTPGHADFSEDTLRTLAAVDAAIMLIDHAKGIEERTRRLFEVCRQQQLPVVTFMNKLDREGRHPMALLDEVAGALDLEVAPVNWPIGMGREFRGVADLDGAFVTLFGAQAHGQQQADERRLGWAEAAQELPPSTLAALGEDLELVRQAGDAFADQAFLAGQVSPVFWGSAANNFGIRALLDFVARRAPGPRPRTMVGGVPVDPQEPAFSGFVFKVQANMNPRHRDRIAFVRVVSGRFQRGMEAILGRTGAPLKLAKPHSFLAQERAIVDDAWPGDIVGLHDPGALRIGDTLAEGRAIAFAGIPRFAPEHFARLQLADPLRRKALDAGIEQLAHEGVVQVFAPHGTPLGGAYLGAVGMLQFEVLVARLAGEYRAPATLMPLPFRYARWVDGTEAAQQWLLARRDYPLALDRHGRWVVLVETAWALDYALREAPGLILHAVEPL